MVVVAAVGELFGCDDVGGAAVAVAVAATTGCLIELFGLDTVAATDRVSTPSGPLEALSKATKDILRTLAD